MTLLQKFNRWRYDTLWQQIKAVYWALVLYTLTVAGVAAVAVWWLT